ncbi:MAG TPA: acetylxylan esterase [Planctomycetota bacterium]|nr:acetylxylan esterase [Planctomycetota bacterium]
MKKPFAFQILAVVALAFQLGGAFAAEAAPVPILKFAAKTDRADAFYKKGETVTFSFSLTDKAKPVADGEVKWTLSKDGFGSIGTGSAKLDNGNITVTGKLDEPGILQCRVSYQAGKNAPAVTALAGAAIDPLELKPSLPVPDDFDAFWAGQKKKLAEIPLKATLTEVKSAAKDVASFDVQIECAGGVPVSGYFAKPEASQSKSLPIILTVHGAGVRSAGLSGACGWAARGFLAMDINAHGIPNGKPDAFYKELADGKLKDYRSFGRDSRETCYFVNMFLREIRALDYLCSLPEWDGRNVIVYGGSQGGFQAFAAAGLDERVTFFAAGVPAGCDHSGNVVGRIAGWPKLVPIGPDGKPDPKVLEAARYVDNVNFATRTKAKGCIVTTGFIDTTCPPSSVYTAYNALTIPKQIHTDPLAGHTSTPGAAAAMQKAVMEYIKTAK